VPLLDSAGLVSSIDRAALTGYCIAWSRWICAEDKLREVGLLVEGARGPAMNPYLRIANESMAQVRAFLVEFGMSPSSRARVATSRTSHPTPADGIRDFLNAKRDDRVRTG
jgi:P27 family predicted phage terminase small subunit